MRKFFVVLIIFLIIPIVSLADEINSPNYDDYKDVLDGYDLSSFNENLDEKTISILKELGINEFDLDNLYSLTFSDFTKILEQFVLGKISSPLESMIEILVFIFLSSFIRNFKESNESNLQTFYSAGSTLIIVLILSSKLSNTISIACSTISISANFIYAFVPAFFIIISASGGITTSISTNTFLLLLSQSLSFISSTVFLPIINCFMAIGICSSIGDNLNLYGLVSSIKRVIIKGISFISGTFISILSIKTAVASHADLLGLRSMRFAINSVVPVIGSAISEGLLSIQSYSSLIKTSVGVVAIIAIMLLFLPSIIDVTLWRLMLSLCHGVSEIFDDRGVSDIIEVFKDTFLLINVVLILSMVTSIISFGILIAAKTG